MAAASALAHQHTAERNEARGESQSQSCQLEVAYDEFLKIPNFYGAGGERLWTREGRPLLRLPLEAASRELITEENRGRFRVRGNITPGLHWIGAPYRLDGNLVGGFKPVEWIKTGVVRGRLEDPNSESYREIRSMVRDTVGNEEKLKAYIDSPAELNSVADEALELYRRDLLNLDPKTGLGRMYGLMQGDLPDSQKKPLSKFLHDGLGTSQAQAQIAARVAEVVMSRVIAQGLKEAPASCLNDRGSPTWAAKNREMIIDLVLQRYRACILSNSLINEKGVEFCMNQELPKISEYLGDLLTQILLRETLDTSVPANYLSPEERVEALERARKAFRTCHQDNQRALGQEMSLHISFCVSMSVYPAVRHMITRALDKKLEAYVPNHAGDTPPNRKRRDAISQVIDSLNNCPALIHERIKTDTPAGRPEYDSFLSQYFSMQRQGTTWVSRGGPQAASQSQAASQIVQRAAAQIKSELTQCIGEIVRNAGEVGVRSELVRNDAVQDHLGQIRDPGERQIELNRLLDVAIAGAYRPCMNRQPSGEALPNPEECKEFVISRVGADVIEKRLPVELMQRVVELFPRNALDPALIEVVKTGRSLDRALTDTEKEALAIVQSAQEVFGRCTKAAGEDLTQKSVAGCMGRTLKDFMPKAAASMLKHHPDYKISVDAKLAQVLESTVARCVDERIKDVAELAQLQAATTRIAAQCTAAIKHDALVPVAALKAEPIIRSLSTDPELTESLLSRYRQHILEPERRAMQATLGTRADPVQTDQELERAKESIMWNSYRFVGLNASLDLFKAEAPDYVEELRGLMTRPGAFSAVREAPDLLARGLSILDVNLLLRQRIAAERRNPAPQRQNFASDGLFLTAQNQHKARTQINNLLEKILDDHMSPAKRNYLIFGDESATTKRLFPPNMRGVSLNPLDLEARLKVLEANLSREVAYQKLALTALDLFPSAQMREDPRVRRLSEEESTRFRTSTNPQEVVDSLIDDFSICKSKAREGVDCNAELARGAASRLFGIVSSDTLTSVLDVPSSQGYFAPRLKPGVEARRATLADYEFHPWDQRPGALVSRLRTQIPPPTAGELQSARSDRVHALQLRRGLERGVLRQTQDRIRQSPPSELPVVLTEAEIKIVEQVALSTITHTLHGQLAPSGENSASSENSRQGVAELLQGSPGQPGPSIRFRECIDKSVRNNLRRPRSEISEAADLCIRFYALGFPSSGRGVGVHPGFGELAGLKVADSLLVHLPASDRAALREKFRNRLVSSLQQIQDPPRSPGFKDRITGVLQSTLLELALEVGIQKSRYDLSSELERYPMIRGSEALHQLIDAIANGRRYLGGAVGAAASDSDPRLIAFDQGIEEFGKKAVSDSLQMESPPSVDELRRRLATQSFFKDSIRGSVAATLYRELYAQLVVTSDEAKELSDRSKTEVKPTDRATQGLIRMSVSQIVSPQMLNERLVFQGRDLVSEIQEKMIAQPNYSPENDPALKGDLVRSLFRPSEIAHRGKDAPEAPEELLVRSLARVEFNQTANQMMGITPGQTPGYWGLTGRGILYGLFEVGAGNRTEINNVLRDSPSGQRATDLFRRYVVYKTTGEQKDRPAELSSITGSNPDEVAQKEMQLLTELLKGFMERGSEELTWGNSTLNRSRNEVELFEYRKKEREKLNAAEEARERVRRWNEGRIRGVDDRFRGPKY
jgi:hypothetical protein